jgi:hypothetical protein
MVSGNVIPGVVRSTLRLLNTQAMRRPLAWQSDADLFGNTNLL